MTAKSQTVDDLVRGSKNKLEYNTIDAKFNGRAKEFFDKATIKLDPNIYKGEAGAYRSEEKGSESPVKTLDRMYDQSESVKNWFGNERHEIEKGLPPNLRGYNFQRDTAGALGSADGTKTPVYSGSFEDVAKQYLMTEGKELFAHLKGKGRDFYDITRIGTQKEGLESAIAGLAVYGNEAALIGSKDFDAKVSQLAGQYGVSKERAITYVMSHELVHASQKGKYFDDPIMAESDVEHTLKEYFTQKGDHDLAAIASDRASKVTSNYGNLGSYKAPKGAGDYKGSLNARTIASYSGKAGGYSGKSGGKASAASSN